MEKPNKGGGPREEGDKGDNNIGTTIVKKKKEGAVPLVVRPSVSQPHPMSNHIPRYSYSATPPRRLSCLSSAPAALHQLQTCHPVPPGVPLFFL